MASHLKKDLISLIPDPSIVVAQPVEKLVIDHCLRTPGLHLSSRHLQSSLQQLHPSLDDLGDLVSHCLTRRTEGCLEVSCVIAVLLDDVFTLFEAFLSDGPRLRKHLLHHLLSEDWNQRLSILHISWRYFFNFSFFLFLSIISLAFSPFVRRLIRQSGDDHVIIGDFLLLLHGVVFKLDLMLMLILQLLEVSIFLLLLSEVVFIGQGESTGPPELSFYLELFSLLLLKSVWRILTRGPRVMPRRLASIEGNCHVRSHNF